ncbi:TIGR03086 family metal-binding protein [Actinomadura violacea]|uniref:TIGR03086 family protein n=1 Tax=Actinomadura violacea TaxID=2819934 RepID=A0ABS3RTD7_9ACTN|nr:TIGR03086 family metal-binding protein [Actinomadura violacea]MBO2460021.1 TIGR03086 family protein [Actinomadura violacea]
MIDLTPACDRMADVLAGVADDQLADGTPCTEYTVRDLIAHIDEVSRGFAALARGQQAPAAPDDAGFDGDGRERVAEHVRALGEAWTDPAAWEGTAETGGLELPGERWGKIAFTEIVVHGWDLARATGRPFDLPDETLRACLDHVAEFVPKAPLPNLWAPAVAVPDDAPLLDRIVGITGRTP